MVAFESQLDVQGVLGVHLPRNKLENFFPNTNHCLQSCVAFCGKSNRLDLCNLYMSAIDENIIPDFLMSTLSIDSWVLKSVVI